LSITCIVTTRWPSELSAALRNRSRRILGAAISLALFASHSRAAVNVVSARRSSGLTARLGGQTASGSRRVATVLIALKKAEIEVALRLENAEDEAAYKSISRTLVSIMTVIKNLTLLLVPSSNSHVKPTY